jgi:hypothetical protein
MSFELVGFGDVGSMHTGVHRDQSRAVLGDGFEEFYKAPESTVPTDAYDDLGVHVYFDEQYTVIGMEFLKWSDLRWRGQRLVGAPVLEVQQFLKEQVQALDFNSSGFEAGELGLRLYAPDMGEDDAVVEAVYACFVRINEFG